MEQGLFNVAPFVDHMNKRHFDTVSKHMGMPTEVFSSLTIGD